MVVLLCTEVIQAHDANQPQKEFTGKLTVKGQGTVPQEVRRFLGVRPQDAIVFRIVQGKVELLPAPVTPEEAFGAVTPIRKPEDFKKLRKLAVEERMEHRRGGVRLFLPKDLPPAA